MARSQIAKNKKLLDLNAREIGLIAPLVLLMVFMGVYPQPVLQSSKASILDIQKRVLHQAGGDIDKAETEPKLEVNKS